MIRNTMLAQCYKDMEQFKHKYSIAEEEVANEFQTFIQKAEARVNTIGMEILRNYQSELRVREQQCDTFFQQRLSWEHSLLEARTKQHMQQATLREFQSLLESVDGSQNLDFFEKLESISDNLQKME